MLTHMFIVEVGGSIHLLVSLNASSKEVVGLNCYVKCFGKEVVALARFHHFRASEVIHCIRNSCIQVVVSKDLKLPRIG